MTQLQNLESTSVEFKNMKQFTAHKGFKQLHSL